MWADPIELNTLRGDAIASLLYVANWRFIFSHQSYFEQFAAPSPLRHTWSLAIEEQWYLFWPIVVSVGYRLTKAKDRTWIIAIAVAAAASAVLMAVLYNPDTDPSRIYYGTDTRAQPLLIGAALAFILHNRTLTRIPKLVLETLALTGLIGIFAMFYLVDDTTPWMYYGGFTLIAVTTSLLIAVIVQPGPSIAQRLLALPPLPLIGRASYGLYLWHWPIYVFLTPDRTGLDGDQLLWLRLAVTGIVASASYNLIEMPIRHGALRRLASHLAPRHPGRLAVAATIITAIILTTLLIPATNTPTQLAGGQLRPIDQRAGDVRVLAVGDSVTDRLAVNFTRELGNDSIALDDVAVLGCGVTRSRSIRTPPQETTTACTNRVENWKRAVADFKPQLTVMWSSVWETFDLTAEGKTYTFGTPEFESFLQRELDYDLSLLTAGGGKVLLLNTPCRRADVQTERHENGVVRRVWMNNQLEALRQPPQEQGHASSTSTPFSAPTGGTPPSSTGCSSTRWTACTTPIRATRCSGDG